MRLANRFDPIYRLGMSTVFSPGRRRAAAPGFSLVEVTMALGLISFALLAMIGLIPAGLGSLRDSTQQSVNAQILQQISSGLAVNGFASRSEFSDFGGTNLYFDAEAQALPDAAGARYKAAVTAQSPSLPGVATNDADLSTSLKRLGISVSREDIPNAATNFYSLQLSYR